MQESAPIPPSLVAPGQQARHAGLDAARALAILMVMGAHDAGFIGAWTHHPAPIAVSLAGPFGVELFFVLSGYLIGNLLLDITAEVPDWPNLAIFLVRRWLRTLPLYCAWLLVLLVLAPPPRLFSWHALHYATLTQNLTHGMPPGDFFAVSWSLSVEEWFYALFAVAAVGGVALSRSTSAFPTAIALFLVLPAVARWQVPLALDYANSIEKVALLNLDSIARGVLMAWVLRRGAPGPWAALALAIGGAALIAMIWTGQWAVSPRVFRCFLTTVVGTGWALCLPLCLVWRRSGGMAGTVIRFVSNTAYGLYITHYTVLEHVRGVLPLPLAIVVGLVLPFGLAALTWYALERPILRLRPKQRMAWNDASEDLGGTCRPPQTPRR